MVTKAAFSVRERARIRELRRALSQASTGHRADAALATAVAACAVGILLIVLLIAASMVAQSIPTLREFGFGFVIGRVWDPVDRNFGALPFTFGTLATSALALLIGGPVAFGTAVALSELVPGALRGTLSALVELLAALP